MELDARSVGAWVQCAIQRIDEPELMGGNATVDKTADTEANDVDGVAACEVRAHQVHSVTEEVGVGNLENIEGRKSASSREKNG